MAKQKTFKFGGVSVPILDQSGNKVPGKNPLIDLPEEQKKAIAIGIKTGKPILLIGETGTGKTSVARYLAYKRKQSYVRINMHGYNTPDELIGSTKVKNGSTFHEDGVLTAAMKEGALVVLDEVNATPPDCLFILHGLLDDDQSITLPDGTVVRPHEDFRLVFTMNQDYEGTRSLNRAFLDRFSIILNIEIATEEQEINILTKRCKLKEDVAKLMVATAKLGRKAYFEKTTLTLISTRSLIQWGNLINEGLEAWQAYDLAISNKSHPEENEAFKDFYNMTFANRPNVGKSSKGRFTLVDSSEVDNLKNEVSSKEKEIKSLNKKLNELEKVEEDAEAIAKEAEKFIEVRNNLRKELKQTEKERDEFKTKLEEIQAALVTN